MVLRWLWWRITARGEIAAIITSTLLAPFLLIAVEQEALRLLLMALCATLAGIGTSLLGGPEERSCLREFYQRVQPPGFWSAIARDEGVDPAEGVRRLGRGLSAAGLAALSIFSMLTALGSWLARSPAPTWFPWPGPWIGLLALASVALVPLWWRLGFGRELGHRGGA